MTTSTPLSKLYGYLKGFESACFTGSSKQEVVSSFQELLTTEMSILGIDTSDASTSEMISSITRYADTFLTKYYGRMRNLQSKSEKIADMADKSKSDSKYLQVLMSSLLSGSQSPVGSFAVCTVSGDRIKSVIDICDKCPYYLYHKFCLLYDSLVDDELVSYEFIQFRIPEYKYLGLAMVKIVNFLVSTGICDVNSLINYHMLFEYIVSISRIYELMNPSGSVRQKYLDDAEALLTQEPLDIEDPRYQYWESVLESVFDDIKEGKKRYIQDIKSALNKCERYTKSKYDPLRDSYFSMKSSAQNRFTGCRESLISSCFEIDQYEDRFREFDEYTGYISRYPKYEEGIIPADLPSVRTILINNPGKFKPRIIHIGDNPIQDRCFYIHNRLKKILDSMRCDCTSNQDSGRQFLKEKTLEWFLKDTTSKPGIYCFDFSNATDTLDQHFQYRVLDFVFGPVIADFWDEVSRLDKYIIDVDGKYHKYTQLCGQPQGLGGSFDAFALAHHFIFLMDMKVCGLENQSATDFYRVLGDDSISNSIHPECDTFDPNGSQVDESGIHRSQMEMVHFDICRNFAGFKINYDKSESTHYTSSEAKLDFAKVTFRNGQLFTPVPFRLAMNYSKSDNNRLAVAIWRMERGDPKCCDFLEQVLTRLPDRVRLVMRSGQVPYLQGFSDPSLVLNESFAARIRYATALTYLTTALGFIHLSDKDRDMSEEDIFDKALRTLFTKKVKERIDNIDPNHKVMLVLEQNAEILQLLDEIYEFDQLDDQYLALACSTLGHEALEGAFGDHLYDLAQTSRLLRLAKDNLEEDVSTVYPDFDMRWAEKLRHFSNAFITRGIAKKPREEVFMLQNILFTLKQLDDILGVIPDTDAVPA